MRLLVKGGLVLTDGGMRPADVLVVDGLIEEVGEEIEPDDTELVDATGCWVGPGLVDLHTHLREPGEEWKEDLYSGSRAAAAGGFTAVVVMPNTIPAIDSGHVARMVRERAERIDLVEIIPAGAITIGRQGGELAHLDELCDAGVTLFTDDGDSVQDAGLLRRAMEYLMERTEGRAVLAQHAEDRSLSRGGHMHEGRVSSRVGIEGIPAIAEETVVSRDLALARLTGARYHVQHVSTARTVEMIHSAKAEGLQVTAEVTPHHLSFTEADVAELNPDFKMYPPLRTDEDRQVLRAALVDGTIDAVATDHAPHAAHECEVPFAEAPRGIIGLETAIPAYLDAIGDEPELLFECLSSRPAAIAGLDGQGGPLVTGRVANVTVIDPTAFWTASRFHSKSRNSPWIGRELRGRAIATIFRGRLTGTT